LSLVFYINGKKSDPPLNSKEIELELSYENENPSASVTTTNFKFVKTPNPTDAFSIIKDYYDKSVSGANEGLLYGLPFEIKLKCNNSYTTIFDGVLDGTGEDVFWGDDFVQMPIKEIGKVDFLNTEADTFSFRYLANLTTPTGGGLQSVPAGQITSADYVDVYYIQQKMTSGAEVASLGLSVFILVKEVKLLTKNLSHHFAELPTVMDTVGGILALIAEVAYLIAIIISLVVLLRTIINAIYPAKRKYRAMTIKKHFQKACAHMGLNFKSSIFDNTTYSKVIIIPKKTKRGVGYRRKSNDVGYYDVTFSQFLQEMQDLFNAKVKIVGSTLHFETKRHSIFDDPASFTIPDVAIEGFKTNASELKSNFVLDYAVDSADLNSFEDVDYRFGADSQIQDTDKVYQITVETSKSLNNSKRKRSLKKGLKSVSIPYARARVKLNFTEVEKVLLQISKMIDPIVAIANTIRRVVEPVIDVMNDFIDVLNDVLDLVSNVVIPSISSPFPKGGFTNTFSASILNRKNVLLLEQHLIGVPRLAVHGRSGTLDYSLGNTLLSLSKIWSSFHASDSPVPKSGQISKTGYPLGNQWLLYDTSKDGNPITIPLCCDDYLKLKDKNIVKYKGNTVRIDSLVYNPHRNTAEIRFRRNFTYIKSIKERKG